MEDLAARIKRLRESHQWTQSDLAKKVQVSRVAVTKWESGETSNIKLNNLMRLCELFGVDPTALVTGRSGQFGANDVGAVLNYDERTLLDGFRAAHVELQKGMLDMAKGALGGAKKIFA